MRVGDLPWTIHRTPTWQLTYLGPDRISPIDDLQTTVCPHAESDGAPDAHFLGTSQPNQLITKSIGGKNSECVGGKPTGHTSSGSRHGFELTGGPSDKRWFFPKLTDFEQLDRRGARCGHVGCVVCIAPQGPLFVFEKRLLRVKLRKPGDGPDRVREILGDASETPNRRLSRNAGRTKRAKIFS